MYDIKIVDKIYDCLIVILGMVSWLDDLFGCIGLIDWCNIKLWIKEYGSFLGYIIGSYCVGLIFEYELIFVYL